MKVILSILFFLSQFSLFAQSFTASVSENKVGENDRFELTFTFEGKDISGLSNFTPPALREFRILSGPNQSTSMQIINGVSSGSISYSYILLPNSTGSFTIGKASIEQSGNIYSSQPLTITVVKGSQKPKEEKSNVISDEEIAKNLFIRATADKNSLYIGEQVTITYKLYTRLNIASQMSVNKLPQYQGFWAEELQTANNISFNTEVLNGKQYRVGTLKKVALFPSQTGSLEVTPFEIAVPIQIEKKRNPNNIWDSFFNDPFNRGEIYEYNARSNVIKLNVLELPGNKPASFKGAVGRYQFQANLDKSSTKTNEPLSLNLKISGSGNIKLLDMPSFELPTGFETYDPKLDDKIIRTAKISGEKTAEYLLVPRISGIREIPPIEFSYFDPSERRFITLRSQSFRVKIEEGDSAGNYLAADKESIKELGNDIRFIKTEFDDIGRESAVLLYQPAYWVAVSVPLLAFIGLIGWKRKQDKLSGNVQLLKFQRAQKVAKTRLKNASRFLEQNNSDKFYTEISQAFFGYLEDKLHIPKSEFTLDKAYDEMKNRKVEENLCSKMKSTGERCDFLRFAPNSNASSAMKDIYDEFVVILTDIEKALQK